MSSVPNILLTKIKGFDILAKYFDVVELDQSNTKFDVLTCKDRVKKQNCIIEYEVWLSLKIRKSFENMPVSFSHNDIDLIEGCIKRINDWLPCLKKSNEHKQLSLFNNDEPQLEDEPPSPSYGDDSSWNGYFKKLYGVRKRNLMKQYSFIELFDFNAYWSYRDINYNALAPSKEELTEIVKKGILKYKNNPGRHDDVWNDDNCGYINGSGPLSDYELFHRVFHCFRFFIMPYKKYKHLHIDDSYSISFWDESIEHRFYFDYGKLNGDTFSSRATLEVNLFNAEFIQWLRDTFNVQKAEYKTDETILEHSLRKSLNHFNINIDDLKFRHFEEFKSFFEERTISSDNDSAYRSSFYDIDGYSIDIIKDKKKSKIVISQRNKFRKVMNYPIPEEFEDDFKTTVIELNYKQIAQAIYDLFNKPPYRQETLF